MYSVAMCGSKIEYWSSGNVFVGLAGMNTGTLFPIRKVMRHPQELDNARRRSRMQNTYPAGATSDMHPHRRDDHRSQKQAVRIGIGPGNFQIKQPRAHYTRTTQRQNMSCALNLVASSTSATECENIEIT
jgi:hypothetical protein